jgi:aminoglycoside 3-N-acetyltransferase
LKELLNQIYSTIDKEWLHKHTKALASIERKQTFEAYKLSAEYVLKLLLENGFAAEKIRFPADGKTVYQDKRMPLAWDANIGRLTILSSPVPFDNPVVADFEKEPFSLIKHSVSTSPEGIITRLITESQMRAGEDCTGAMVLLDPDSTPRYRSLIPALDLGALGIVSENVTGSFDTPDTLQWVNACTEGCHWHVQCEDRPFIGFSVTPRTGRQLRYAANTGEVKILVESDGHRYKGDLFGVTALIPGRQKKELWVMAHLYEPLIDDNSSGVIGTIALVIQIQNLIKKGILPSQEFSLRLIFALEMYGFAAFANYFGDYLGDRAIGAINIDGMPVGLHDKGFKIFLPPQAVPFFGSIITKMIVDDYNLLFDKPRIMEIKYEYVDDMFLSDTTTRLPTIWPISYTREYWHNSIKTGDYLDMESFARAETFYATLIAKLITLNAKELPDVLTKAINIAKGNLNERTFAGPVRSNEDGIKQKQHYLELEKECLEDFRRIADISQIDDAKDFLEVSQKTAIEKKFEQNSITSTLSTETTDWFDYAASITPSRIHIGFPFDQVKIPKNQRLADSVIYGHLPIVRALAKMNGEKNLQEIIKEVEWEIGEAFNDETIQKHINILIDLKNAGYISLKVKNPLKTDIIAAALEKAGVKKNDLLLVYSDSSQTGYIEGGANTIIDSIIKAIGPKGTLLMPVFTNSLVSAGGNLNKKSNFRPFNVADVDSILTGEVSKTFLQRTNTKRSMHATNSWSGAGPLADKCLNEHKLLDPPLSENSPMAKALEYKGKVLFFGCDISCNTFLHYLEYQSESVFLENAIVKIRDKGGRLYTEIIRKYFSGHRDFHSSPAIDSKFYKKAVGAGLKIKKERLGLGYIHLIDLQRLYKIGMEILSKDPYVTLCDRKDCLFCRQYNKV